MVYPQLNDSYANNSFFTFDQDDDEEYISSPEEAVPLEEDFDNEIQPPTPPAQENEVIIRNQGITQIAEKVIYSLMNKKHLLIECPTLLDRKMAILKQILRFWHGTRGRIHLDEVQPCINDDLETAPFPEKIYVVTRNFHESNMFCTEMNDLAFKATGLLRNIKVTILGSSESPHEKRQSLGTENEMTNNLGCQKRTADDDQASTSNCKKARMDQLNDFSQFVGKVSTGKQLEDTQELVICPADYIMSSFCRQEHAINLTNSIVFIDDGYDLENTCRNEGSIKVEASLLNQGCSALAAITESQVGSGNVNRVLAELASFLEELAVWMDDDENNEPCREDIMEILQSLSVGLNFSSLTTTLLDVSRNLAAINPNFDDDIIQKLRKLVAVLQLLVSSPDGYVVELTKQQRSQINPNNNVDTVLKLNCADPKIILEPIANAAISLIVGSNSLAPYSPFFTEFGGIFSEDQILKIQYDDHTMRNRHLIVYTGKCRNGYEFDLNYRNRAKPIVKEGVSLSLVEICGEIPNGVLVLFHSEEYFKRIQQFMAKPKSKTNGNSILDQLKSIKPVFSELDMKTDADIQRKLHEFQVAASGDGAVLLALSRGKLLKSLESQFGNIIRGVVHVSIPFAPWGTDDAIVSKREYLDRKYADTNSVENKDWYTCESFRPLNQSFSVCVKQRKDWGITIILDTRMHEKVSKFNDLLPEWVRYPRPGVRHHTEFQSLIRNVKNKVLEWTRDETPS